MPRNMPIRNTPHDAPSTEEKVTPPFVPEEDIHAVSPLHHSQPRREFPCKSIQQETWMQTAKPPPLLNHNHSSSSCRSTLLASNDERRRRQILWLPLP